MGLQINQYPIERTELGADDFLDIDYWDGTQYRSAKIKGGAISKKYLAFEFQNDLGVTIPKGTIVYLRQSSTSANYPHVDLANSSTELTSSKTIGAIYDDVANGAIGLIVQVGEVDNLDTSAYNVGDRLWLSNVNGQVTTTIPQTPEHAVFIGIVTRSQNGNGRIVYNIQNGYEVEELHNVLDVNYTTPQDEDSFLIFDETQQIWKKITLSNSLIYGQNYYDNIYQEQLISGTNIKTINGSSVLGSGDLVVGGGSALPLALEYNDTDLTIWSNGKNNIVSNTNFGEETLKAITTGYQNTMFGFQTGRNVQGGYKNVGFGNNVLNATTTGYANIAIGNEAMYASATANTNIAIGDSALRNGTLGYSNNIAIGQSALQQTSNAFNNTAIGTWSLLNNQTGSGNTAVGYRTLRQTSNVSNITAFGSNVMENNSTGTFLTGVGYFALQSNTTGAQNTGVGYCALYQNTTGSNNTALGDRALLTNTTGTQNVGVGVYAGYSTSNGNYNTSVGYSALYSNINGNQNVAVGTNSLYNITSGSNNVGIGWGSSPSSGSATDSVSVGYFVKGNTGSIVLGSNASSTSGTHCVVLGRDASATSSNQFVVGSTTYNAGSVTTESNSSTKVWNVIINGVAQKILLA